MTARGVLYGDLYQKIMRIERRPVAHALPSLYSVMSSNREIGNRGRPQTGIHPPSILAPRARGTCPGTLCIYASSPHRSWDACSRRDSVNARPSLAKVVKVERRTLHRLSRVESRRTHRRRLRLVKRPRPPWLPLKDLIVHDRRHLDAVLRAQSMTHTRLRRTEHVTQGLGWWSAQRLTIPSS